MTATRSIAATTTLVALLATPLAMGTAQAKGTAAVVKQGACSGGGAHYTLKAQHDNGLIEVEWQVDANKVGQKWSVRLRDNGALFFSGTRTTQAPSGSFTVNRTTANRAGGDVIRARSVHGSRSVVTGSSASQRCTSAARSWAEA